MSFKSTTFLWIAAVLIGAGCGPVSGPVGPVAMPALVPGNIASAPNDEPPIVETPAGLVRGEVSDGAADTSSAISPSSPFAFPSIEYTGGSN